MSLVSAMFVWTPLIEPTPPSRIFQRDAAIDDELEPGDVAALVACEIERGVGDVPGISPEAHGHLARPNLPQLLLAAIRRREPRRFQDHRRLHQARQDGVHADLLRRVL